MKLIEIKKFDDFNKKISLEEVLSLIKTDYSDSWNQFYSDKVKLYRGIILPAPVKYCIVDPTVRERESKSLPTNYYNTLFSKHLNSWKEFPPRNKSLICASIEDKARNFGRLHLVLPKNGAKLGVCPFPDFWNCFSKALAAIKADNPFEKIIKNNLSNFDSHSKNQYDRDLYALPDFEDMLFSLIYDFSSSLEEIIKLKDENGNTLLSYFEKYFDPDFNNIHLKNITDKINDRAEVWTDSKSIVIDISEILAVKTAFEESK
jgi:hypothetical protein